MREPQEIAVQYPDYSLAADSLMQCIQRVAGTTSALAGLPCSYTLVQFILQFLQPHPRGQIQLQSEAAEAYYKNLRIRPVEVFRAILARKAKLAQP